METQPIYDHRKVKAHFERAISLKGWNKAEAAFRMGFSQSYFSRILTGKDPGLVAIPKIANKLGVDIRLLLADENEPDTVGSGGSGRKRA